jgi:hypothetical protein
MAGYGEPTRTPAQDANEGIVNPPASPVAARTGIATHKKELSGGDIALQQASQTLGGIVQSFADKKADETRLTLMNEGAARQGQATAINEIDQENKRSGLAEHVFGQSATYRGAQQRAVTNNVMQAYLEDHYAIAEHAQDTPEAYQSYLSARLKKMVEPFAGDTETQNMIASTWNKSTEKLATLQSKEHFGYTQLENRKEVSKQLRGKFDAISIAKGDFPEDSQVEFIGTMAKAMYDDVPENMSKEAYHSLLDEEVNYALSKGSKIPYEMSIAAGIEANITLKQETSRQGYLGAYAKIQQGKQDVVDDQNELLKEQEQFGQDMVNKSLREGEDDVFKQAKAEDSFQPLTLKQQIARDTAVGKYDEIHHRKGETAWEGVIKAVNHLGSAEDKDAAMTAAFTQYLQDIAQLEQDSSGSAKGTHTIADLKNRLPKLITQMVNVNASEKMKAELDRLAYNAIQGKINGNGDQQTQAVGVLAGMTTSVKQKAMNKSVLANIGHVMGQDKPIALEDLTQAMLSNPDVIPEIKRMMTMSGVMPTEVKNIVNQLVRNAGSRTGSNGLATMLGKDELRLLTAFDAEMFTILGGDGDQLTRWTTIKDGVAAGWDPDKIAHFANERIERNKNKGSDLYADANEISRNPKDDIKNKGDIVRGIFKDATGQKPTDRQMADHMELYTRALEATGNHEDAVMYMTDVIVNDSITVNGNYVAGGAYLNDDDKKILGDYDLDTFLELASRPMLTNADGQPNISVMTYMLNLSVGNSVTKDKATVVTNLEKVKGWEITADPRQNGFYFHVSSGVGDKIYFDKETIENKLLPVIALAKKQANTKELNDKRAKAMRLLRDQMITSGMYSPEAKALMGDAAPVDPLNPGEK